MATSRKLSIKLVIDTKRNSVLYAEAEKDFVDLLFSFLLIPVESINRLLTQTKMVGCIGNLYQSVENLNEKYILEPNVSKELLLKPKPPTPPEKYYICNSSTSSHFSCFYVTTDSTNTCPYCRNKMSYYVTLVAPKEKPVLVTSGTGYVKDAATYLVADDLSVMPLSTVSIIALMNKFNVENVSVIEERIVDLDSGKGLELLKASLHSKIALTEVFLGKGSNVKQKSSMA